MTSNKNNTFQLSLRNFGYTLETREITISRERGPQILTPRLQKKISKATRNNNTITLIKDVVVCPYCGNEIPAYSGYLFGKNHFLPRHYNEIEKWSTYQMSFLGEEPTDLFFQTPVNITQSVTCSKCFNISGKSNGEFKEVSIIKRRKKLIIKLKIELKDISSLAWITHLSLCEFNLYESITFNLNNGHTYLNLLNGKGKCYSTLDITRMDICTFKHDPIVEIVENYKAVYRILKNFLRPYWNGSLPFSEKELYLERYILLTKFIGYDEYFYKTLPVTSNENVIEKSFVNIANKLHHKKYVPQIYEKSNLPNEKSIRYIINTRPSFLFYKKELEVLWLSFNNVSYFQGVIEAKSPNFWSTLEYLHNHPPILQFIIDYAEYAGKDELFSYLTKSYPSWELATDYATMSEEAKSAERIRWISDHDIYLYSIPTQLYSEENSKLPSDCMINGYRFSKLRNRYEYLKAKEDLGGCSPYFEGYDYLPTYYGIMKNEKYVAAVETDKNTIVRVYKCGNNDIVLNKKLYSAFKLWIANNRISYQYHPKWFF